MNVALFLEIKNEYTEHLVDTLTPYIYEGLTQIYGDAVRIAKDSGREDKTLITFQKLLQSINTWNQLTISEETNRIKQLSNTFDYLDDLVKAVIKSNIILLTYSNNISNVIAQSFYNNFTTQTFIHRCYAECGKDAHNNPFLFYCDVEKPMDYKRNQVIIQHNIREGIARAVRKVLPISMILKEYLVNSINIIQEPTKIELVGANTNPVDGTAPLMGINTHPKIMSDKKIDPKLEQDVMKIIKTESAKTDKDKIQALINMDKLLSSIEPKASEANVSKVAELSGKKSTSARRVHSNKNSELVIAPHLIEDDMGYNDAEDDNGYNISNNLNNTDKNILNVNIDNEITIEGNETNNTVSGTSLSSGVMPNKSGFKLNPETSERIDPSKIRLIEDYGTQFGGSHGKQRKR